MSGNPPDKTHWGLSVYLYWRVICCFLPGSRATDAWSNTQVRYGQYTDLMHCKHRAYYFPRTGYWAIKDLLCYLQILHWSYKSTKLRSLFKKKWTSDPLIDLCTGSSAGSITSTRSDFPARNQTCFILSFSLPKPLICVTARQRALRLEGGGSAWILY